jgi:hypothetical protein
VTYEEKIAACFKHCCDENKKKDGEHSAAPYEVGHEMQRRGWLSPLDSVLDIEKIMRELRVKGAL